MSIAAPEREDRNITLWRQKTIKYYLFDKSPFPSSSMKRLFQPGSPPPSKRKVLHERLELWFLFKEEMEATHLRLPRVSALVVEFRHLHQFSVILPVLVFLNKAGTGLFVDATHLSQLWIAAKQSLVLISLLVSLLCRERLFNISQKGLWLTIYEWRMGSPAPSREFPPEGLFCSFPSSARNRASSNDGSNRSEEQGRHSQLGGKQELEERLRGGTRYPMWSWF